MAQRRRPTSAQRSRPALGFSESVCVLVVRRFLTQIQGTGRPLQVSELYGPLPH